ncbi:hypothetical protein AB4259_19530 [Vibrio amylolyticus]|uniref:hypothetical protein n=1 Tax=Vibrio amylolyticus TaxID=2847292 RepID=UPI0035504399
MEQEIGWLSVWALVGYFVAPWLPNATTKNNALLQVFIIGPLGWIGVTALVLFKK